MAQVALSVNVRADIKAALAGLARTQQEITRATTASLNRVAVTARAVAAREISAATGIKVNEVRQRVPLIKANKYTLTAVISARPWSPNLIRYGARQTRQGVSANAWRQRKIYRGTFIGNKGRTVFKRTGPKRLPIEPVYGPSVRREFIRDHTLQAINRTVGVRFPIEFGRALRAGLRRG